MYNSTYKRYICLVIVLIFITIKAYPGIQSEMEEYSLKAEYIKKFKDYIEWPDHKIKGKSKDLFLIGSLNETSIHKTLKKAFKNVKIFNRNVDVLKIENIQDISKFNILFVSGKDRKKISEIIEISKKNNILLIGDTPGYALSGIHINFYIKGENLKFEINRNSLLSSGLSVSSHLLSLSKIVVKEGNSQ